MIELPNFENVKPDLLNWIVVGLMALTFIAFAKFAVNHFQNPVMDKLKPLVNSV